ncbi:Myb-like dna-binding protein [Globisporangium polare]
MMSSSPSSSSAIEKGVWSEEEHDAFLEALKVYPEGPWKAIAEHIGTRSSRQVQTHAQKYYEKVGRRMRGLRKDRKKLLRREHKLGEDMATLCTDHAELAETGVRIGQIRRGLKAVATSHSRDGSGSGSPGTADEGSWAQAPGGSGEQQQVDDASSLDWVDALFGDEELASWVGFDANAERETDFLEDVDDCYLNYLVEILDSSVQE